MFARLDENDPVLRKINFSYNRGDAVESELPSLITEEDPKVGQADYVLEWNPVEGAEMYELFWILPSGKLYSFLVVGKTEFNMSKQEGMLDEAGECTLYLFPYGNGLPMSYSGWYCDVTE